MSDFWLGVLITGIITIPLTLMGNLLTPRVSAWLETNNQRLRERNRTKALRRYMRIAKLRADPIHREMYFVRSQMLVMLCIAMVLLAFIVMVLVRTAYATDEELRGEWLGVVFTVFVYTLFFGSVYLTLSNVVRVVQESRAVAGFEEYRAQLMARFGKEIAAQAGDTTPPLTS
jgi:hypothetical protein